MARAGGQTDLSRLVRGWEPNRTWQAGPGLGAVPYIFNRDENRVIEFHPGFLHLQQLAEPRGIAVFYSCGQRHVADEDRRQPQEKDGRQGS